MQSIGPCKFWQGKWYSNKWRKYRRKYDYDDYFEKAKLNELNDWKTNVYEEIPYNNQKLIHVKWVCTMMKETNNQ